MSEDTFADYAAATRTRDAVAKIAQEAVGNPQPLGMVGRLISVNQSSRKARVWLPGDLDPIEVNLLPNIIPYVSQDSLGIVETATTSAAGGGARVWIERVNDKLFITEVFSGPVFAEASGGFESYTDAIGPEAGVAGKAWYVRAAASTAVVVPMPPQNQCVTFGPFGGALGEGYTEITVTDMIFGATKTYQFSGLAAQAILSTPSYFQKMVPRYVNHAEDVDTNRGDFELEIGNAQLVPENTTVPEFFLMLRLRRKNDNQASIANVPDGYRVTIRSNGGMTQAAHTSGNVPFRKIIGEATAPTDTYGTTVFSSTQSQPNAGAYDSPFVDFPRRAQLSIVGGGNIIWDGLNLRFQSFKIMFSGRHSLTFGMGEQYVDFPSQGVSIVEVGDLTTTNKIVGASGIELLPGEGLYYALDPGVASSVSDASRFRIVNSEKSMGIPPYWVLIAGATGAIPSLKLGTGEQLDHKRGVTFQGTWQNVNVSEYAPLTYYMGPNRMVHIEGSARTSGGGAITTAQTVAVLPAGFRPSGRQIFSAVATGTSASRVDVSAAGEILAIAPGGSTFVSMNMTYRAHQ